MESRNLQMSGDFSLDDERYKAKPGQVWITRQHWDGYFLAAILLAPLLMGPVWWYTANSWILLGPIVLVPLWGWIRWTWPREGKVEKTVSAFATPEMIALLWWLLICLLIAL